MIHVDTTAPSQAAVAAVESDAQAQSTTGASVTVHSSNSTAAIPTPVVLSTARVAVRSPSGRAVIVRALLDSGSELTFITEKTAQLLRLTRIRAHTSTSGLNCVDTGICRTAALIHTAPRDCPEPTFTTVAYILKSLTRYVPRTAPSVVEWKHLTSLKLADDDPTGPDPIDLIIGSDLYDRVLVHARHGPVGQPSAIQSHFGWILSGPTSVPQTLQYSSRQVVALHCSLEREVSKLWEMEEVPRQQLPSPEDKRCKEHFIANHSRSADGRYIVRLPFRDEPPIDIGESRSIAEHRLKSLTRRLDVQPDVRRAYSEFLAEYERLGHMSEVSPASESTPQVVYIPHHPVIRTTSATTQLRVVFDASSQTTNGTSLNSHLLAGPKLQLDLPAVLLRWRQHKYVYTADVAKMFRQIMVDPRDRDYQRILWTDGDSRVHEYQLSTVMYGTASVPFLALRVLKQLAKDEGEFFPLAVSVIENEVYVDDFLFGAEDIPLLRQARKQVRDLLRRGGFELRKWASNNAEFLSDIPPENHGLACDKVLAVDNSLTVLGIAWNPTRDIFQFKIVLPDKVPATKRAILSTIARLFDPLGWVTPVTLAAKVLLQQL